MTQDDEVKRPRIGSFQTTAQDINLDSEVPLAINEFYQFSEVLYFEHEFSFQDNPESQFNDYLSIERSNTLLNPTESTNILPENFSHQSSDQFNTVCDNSCFYGDEVQNELFGELSRPIESYIDIDDSSENYHTGSTIVECETSLLRQDNQVLTAFQEKGPELETPVETITDKCMEEVCNNYDTCFGVVSNP